MGRGEVGIDHQEIRARCEGDFGENFRSGAGTNLVQGVAEDIGIVAAGAQQEQHEVAAGSGQIERGDRVRGAVVVKVNHRSGPL